MSIILLQELANQVPTPVAGKGTVFINTASQLVVKDSNGNVSVIPTIESSGNTQVYYNDGGTVSGDPNFTFNQTTGTLTANYVGGTLTSAAQPNVTSVGTLTSLLTGATSSNVDFPNAIAILSEDNTGQTKTDKIGAVGEAVADSGNTAITGIGVLGIARANSATKGTGVQGEAYVTNTADSGAAVGVRGYSGQTHAGGYNIGVLGNAAGSGLGNYAFYVQAGNIGSIETATGWDLVDNEGAALAFNSSGKANILAISSIDGSEGIFGTGYLSVTGNITGGNLIGALANGTSNVKVPSSGGNVTISIGGTSNVIVVTGTGANISGTISASGNANVGNLGTGGLITATGNITGANLITSGLITATGNANVGNLGTAGLITATGNIQGGNINTAGIVSATGNIVSAGNANITGNITGGNANITGTTASTSKTTGALTVAGGIGVAGDLYAGNSITVNNGAYGEVVTTQFASVFGTGSGPNPRSIMQVRAADLTAGIGIQSYSGINGQLYSNTGITFTTGATIRDKDFPTGGTTTATLDSTGLTVTGLVSASGNVTGANLITSGLITATGNANVGNLGTGGLITATGTITGGNLITSGTLSATGNANVGNIGANNAVFTGTGSFGGNVNMNTTNIVNLQNPVNDQDAATKYYVDNVVQGLNIHGSVDYATTGTLAVASGGTTSYDNGSSGVGATITTTGTFLLIDGGNVQNVTTRILVKNEANATWNGIYTWANATALVRATDFNSSADISGGDFTFVKLGTVNADSGWVQTTDNVVVGVSNIVWTQFSGAGTYNAGTGLTLTGTTFSVNESQTQITSVGTLTGLAVNGTVTAVNITANTGVFTGNGSSLTALNASNISTGTLAQARLANASLTVNGTAISLGGSSTITATATNALTLGSYLTGSSYNGSTAVTAAVDATTTNTASKVVARDASGNFAAGTITATLSGAATTAGTVTTAAQPNITSVGTLTSLTLSGTLSGAVQIGTGAATHFGTTLTTGANTTAGTVTGNWTLSAGSKWNASYADLSEKYVADADYGPGTVLVFGGDKEVTLSTELNTTRVAGVVTTDAAYTMNSGLEAEFVADVALQGRVPVKVIGPIYKGDLLVSGGNGHAIANNDARAGTIIGKSLENFTDTTGVIEVAVGRF